jgi:hypothetical protein
MSKLSAEGRRVFLEVVVSVAQIEEGETHDGRKMDALDARFEALPKREQQELLRLLEAVAEAEPLEPAAERPEDGAGRPGGVFWGNNGGRRLIFMASGWPGKGHGTLR